MVVRRVRRLKNSPAVGETKYRQPKVVPRCRPLPHVHRSVACHSPLTWSPKSASRLMELGDIHRELNMFNGPVCNQQEESLKGGRAACNERTALTFLRRMHSHTRGSRRDGGKMEFRVNGMSSRHSDSVNAWARVPRSKLFVMPPTSWTGLERSENEPNNSNYG